MLSLWEESDEFVQIDDDDDDKSPLMTGVCFELLLLF